MNYSLINYEFYFVAVKTLIVCSWSKGGVESYWVDQ